VLNTTDFFIILLVLIAAFDGWRSGILVLLADLVAFGLGLLAAYWLAGPVGAVLGGWLDFSAGLQPLFGFALTFLAVMAAARFALVPVRSRLILGTGRYRSLEETAACIAASGAPGTRVRSIAGATASISSRTVRAGSRASSWCWASASLTTCHATMRSVTLGRWAIWWSPARRTPMSTTFARCS